MRSRSAGWSIIFAVTFLLTAPTTLYLLSRSNQNPLSAPAGYLAADKGYGVTVDLTLYSDEELAETLSILRKNGLLWLRQPIFWAELEPEPGQFNWQPLDRIFSALARSNERAAAPAQTFKLIAVLHTTPGWARPPHTPRATPPTQLSDFGNFARALAGRYGDQLSFYQIWHEPNLSANWGNRYIEPAGYARLLREAALNIREADPDALILNAALAPTLEDNELNLNEIAYLERLYRLEADQWFDIVAGQPYGFDFEPSDPARADRLNFSRLELLRRVMLDHGDADTPIWATAFGWNILPPDWTGRPPPWRSDQDRIDPPELQLRRATDAIAQARRDWPWLGPILAVRWSAVDLPEDDPARGFALLESPAMLATFQAAAQHQEIVTPGAYPATHPGGHYSPGWRFSLLEADIPRDPPRTLTLAFEGTQLDLALNRGPYRGYLWVTIDGYPANALPHDDQGRSYIVLYDPLREGEAVTLARNLSPGPHQAVIEADGGWGQWAISGWTVYHQSAPVPDQRLLVLTALLAILSGSGLAWQFWPQLSHAIKLVVSPGNLFLVRYLELAEPIQIALLFTLALGFFLAPGNIALLLLLPLAAAILLRPDLGLALVTFNFSFFLLAKPLPLGLFLPLETPLLLTTLGFCLRQLPMRQTQYVSRPNLQLPISNYQSPITNLQLPISNLKSLDWAALALTLLAYLSTLTAQNFGVSMHEWRMLVSESALFYFLVRLGRDYGPPQPVTAQPDTRLRWVWRLVDAFIAGATLHAALALYDYFFTHQAIFAEGVHRAIGPIYGSPNNLSLFLGRVWPILLAVAILPESRADAPGHGIANDIRRWLYSAGLLVVSLALLLTFSKGALLVGIPGALLVMALWSFWHDRQYRRGRLVAAIGGWLLLMALALIPFSQTARFQTTFDFSQGSTAFFRLKLWQAAWNMLQDHWLLGVGLNNFLYQYRTRYILPEAWQEPNLSHPHNLILDFGTQLGVGGILLLLWLQGSFWLKAWRLYRKLPHPLVLGLIGSMTVFLSHGLIDNAYFLVDLAFSFFLTVGLIQKLAEDHAEA